MAEPVIQPPVPKPRSSRPLASLQSTEVPEQNETEPERGSSPSLVPQPLPRQKSPPVQTADTLDDDDSEQPDLEPSAPPLLVTAEDSDVVLRRFPSETNGADIDSADEGDYENIDAHLDEDQQENMRKSDYINWVYMDSDGEEVEGAKPIGDRYAPSIKLDRHPALKKSQSSHDFETDSPSLTEAMSLKKQFQQHLQNLKSNKEGFRPKNRAPPPPPGTRIKRERERDKEPQQQQASGDKGLSNGTKSRHKRSQSDIHISSYSDSDPVDEGRVKRSPKLGVSRGPRRSPMIQGKRQHHRSSQESSGASGSGAAGQGSPSVGRLASNTPPSGRGPPPSSRPPHPHGPPPPRPNPAASNSPRLRGQGTPKENRDRSKANYAHVRLRNESGDPKTKPSPGPPERAQLDRLVSKDSNVKPKRHAPPPPKKMGGSPSDERAEETPPPAYASVVKPHRKTPNSETDRINHSTSGDSINDPRPPKPVRMRRTQSVEDLSRLGSSPVPRASSSQVLDSMDVFSINLHKDSNSSLGLVIVKGKARNANGDVVKGIFVQKVLPNSVAYNDGRIQSGDLLVEISNKSMLGASIDEAIQLLKEQTESIRLKIARPDLSRASVYVVEGDKEHNIKSSEGATPSAPSQEARAKLEESQQRVAQLEEEKKDAEASLKAFKEEVQRERDSLQEQLKEMRQMFDQHKTENENVTQLTKTLASVTVEKAKVEQALGDHKSEVETLSKKVQDAESAKEHAEDEARQSQAKLKEVEEANRSLELKVTDFSTQLKDTTDELNRVIEEKKCLWTELVSAREKITDLDERLKSNEELIHSQREEITTLRIELARHSAANVHVETAIQPKAEGPLESETPSDKDETENNKAPLHDDSEVVPTKDKEEDDDAFDNGEPSPVVPHPYIEFLPFEPGSKPQRNKKTEGEKEVAVKAEQPPDTSEKQDGVQEVNSSEQNTPPDKPEKPPVSQPEPQTEHKDAKETQDALPDLYAVPPPQKLDSSAALHKSQVGGMRQKKKPSREHLQKMGSSSNLLDHIPDEQDTQTQTDESNDTKEQEAVTETQAATEQPPASSKTEPVPPKPMARPRPVPRRRTAATIDDKEKPKPPQALPRHKQESIDEHSESSEPVSEIKPSVPQTKESPKIKKKEPLLPSGKFPPHSLSPKTSPKHVPAGQESSPKREPVLPPKPGQNDVSTESKVETQTVSQSPKIAPRQQRKPSHDEIDDTKLAELREKDPSELTVREKAIIAQKAVHDKPVKPPPPVVPHKPKTSSDGALHTAAATTEQDKEGSPVRSRTKSFDNNLESSPRRLKLPPGAVNVWTGQLVPQERDRSVTVSTSEPGARERSTLERHAALKDYSPDHSSSQEEEKSNLHGEEGASPKLEAKIPPKRPPPPGKGKHSITNEQNESQDEVDGDEGADSSQAEGSGQDHELVVNYDQILTWTPDVVGMWVNDIGLGQYRQIFTERGIQGYMLPDMDGHGLKGMGMESHEDRTQFKREVKKLKPFIDKHKKILEKQRKEEKRLAKKKKK